MPVIRQFFKAYITDNEVRDIVEKREFNRLATNAKVSLADFKALNGWRDIIPEYVKDYVHLNQFI
jgi:type I restriction enzyme R subunit